MAARPPSHVEMLRRIRLSRCVFEPPHSIGVLPLSPASLDFVVSRLLNSPGTSYSSDDLILKHSSGQVCPFEAPALSLLASSLVLHKSLSLSYSYPPAPTPAHTCPLLPKRSHTSYHCLRFSNTLLTSSSLPPFPSILPPPSSDSTPQFNFKLGCILNAGVD